MPTIKNLEIQTSEISKTNLPKALSEIMPTDDRLYIPKINENVPISWPSGKYLENEDWVALEAEIQKELENGVAHFPFTAVP